MVSVQYECETDVSLELDCESLAKEVAESVLELENCPYDSQVNLVLTDNPGIHEVNRQFRGIDAPTDVLSFPMIPFETPADYQILDQDEFAESCERSLRAGLTALARRTQEREPSASYLNVLDVDTGEIRTLARFERVVEAPNWMKTRDSLIYNSEGHIYRFDLDTSAETLIDTGSCDNCNNDHVLSPDEKKLAVSHGPRENGFLSRVYTLPITGGEPTLVTPNAPSFLHGWSPDGKELAYCAFREREGKWEVDVYAIPTDGGEEVRLTDGGFNDGPEYSPDGTHIWFNSTRSGLMQVWRMDRDGGHPTQMSTCERNNWFGHVSPDGKRVAYLSYAKGELEPNEHLPNMRVELRIMDADGANDRRLASFFGGQGSMNVNSWAADSRHLAFVSYEILHK